MMTDAFLLTVLGKDCPGIIEKVTGLLYRSGSNLEDISMTVLQGQFAMMLVGAVPSAKQAGMRRSLSALEKKSGLTVFWTDLKGQLRRGEHHANASERYLVSAVGRDRTGIVYRISRLMAQRRLNITDLNSRIIGRGRNTVYSMVLEVDIPHRVSVPALERALGLLEKKLKVEISLKPVERLEF